MRDRNAIEVDNGSDWNNNGRATFPSTSCAFATANGDENKNNIARNFVIIGDYVTSYNFSSHRILLGKVYVVYY